MLRFFFTKRLNLSDAIWAGVATGVFYEGWWPLAVLIVLVGAILSVYGEKVLESRDVD